MTKHGWFSQEDLQGAGALVMRDEGGNRVIRFPERSDLGGLHYRDIPDYKLAEGEVAGKA